MDEKKTKTHIQVNKQDKKRNWTIILRAKPHKINLNPSSVHNFPFNPPPPRPRSRIKIQKIILLR